MENLRRVSKELGENIGDRELEAMIEEFDKNLDGSISFDEFVVSMSLAASTITRPAIKFLSKSS